jgi:hypothetical protein
MPKRLDERDPELAAFLGRNDGLDLLSFDFHSAPARAGLQWHAAESPALRERLKGYQRILRLCHLGERLEGADGKGSRRAPAELDWETATALVDGLGLDSAHAIAAVPEREFVRRAAEVLPGDGAGARELHRRAVRTKARAALLMANVKDSVASTAFRGTRFSSVDGGMAEYYEQIPGYAELFGGLDYLSCPPCRSILSPSAYFVDLMRVADEYVTEPNLTTIPAGLQLSQRRPDLFELPLTCAATEEVVPYLKVVNGVLERRIRFEAGTGDAYHALALAPYPFNLPYHLPLTQLREYLSRLDTPLAGILAALVAPDNPEGVRAPEALRESLRLSIEQAELLSAATDDPVVLSARYGYTATRRATGDGTVAFAAASAEVTGSGTRFTAQVQAGDQILVGRQVRTVAAVQSDTALTVTAPWGAAGGGGYGVARPDRIEWHLPFQGTGQVTVAAGSRAVTGTGTDFTREVGEGDQLEVAGQFRTVVTITSATTLEVGTEWSLAGGPADFRVSPATAIDRGTVFQARTGLGRDAVVSLLVQGLDAAEEARGEANAFFIDATGEGLQPMRLVWDRRDPAAPFERIEQVSASRLDRMSRFIRLAGVLGWTYEETDHALKALGAAEIDAAALQGLGRQRLLQDRLGAEPLAVSSLWADMKTTGRGNAAAPRDFFDRVYNNPRLLAGKTPYAPGSTLPFDPFRTPAQEWRVHEREGEAAVIRNRLLAALEVDDDGLTKAAEFVLRRQGKAVTDALALTLANLSALYRHTVLARLLKLTVDAYLRLRGVLFYPERPYGDPPTGPLTLSQDEAEALSAAAAWLHAAPLDIYQLQYVISGQGREKVVVPYTEAEIRELIDRLSTQAQGARCTAALLAFEEVDAGEADLLVQRLKLLGWLNPLGIFFERPLESAPLAFLFYGTPDAFAGPTLTEAASVQVYGELVEQGYLVPEAWGTVSPAFTAASDLSFLFPEDPDAAAKQAWVRSLMLATKEGRRPTGGDWLVPLAFRGQGVTDAESAAAFAQLLDHGDLVRVPGERARVSPAFTRDSTLDFLLDGAATDDQKSWVRHILLATQSWIQPERDLAHTVDALRTDRAQQEAIAAQGLAQALDSTPDMMEELLDLAAVAGDRGPYLVELLTPLPSDAPLPPSLLLLLDTLSRSLVLAGGLRLTLEEVHALTWHPAWFGIEDLAEIGFAGVRTLETLKRLEEVFHDTRQRLLVAFGLPFTDPDNPARSPRLEELSQVTGWPEGQLRQALEYFAPADHGAALSGTVDGVARLKAVFDPAGQTGTDVAFLVSLGQTARLPLRVGGAFSTANWDRWSSVAGQALSAVKGRYGAERFDALFAEITDRMDASRRDALLPYATFLLGIAYPAVRGSADVYALLLLDVEMGSCARTSLVAQGIASVQLYLQRARLGLEPGVQIDPLEFPDSWWSWLSTYRTWEANRKVFLYPENYIDPTLRRGRTPLFVKLADRMLQTDVTKDSVAEAYRTYFDGLTTVAALRPAAAYRATVRDELGRQVQRMWLVGRTAVDPYRYFYRTLDRSVFAADGAPGPAATVAEIPEHWGPWHEVDLKVPAPTVGAAYAFDRLFLLWIEQELVEGSAVTGGTSRELLAARGRARFSFLAPTGEWSAPQPLAEDRTIDFLEDFIHTRYVQDTAPTAVTEFGFLKPSEWYWHLPGGLVLPATAQTPAAAGDELLSPFGFLISFRTDAPGDPAHPPDTGNRSSVELDRSVFRLTTRINHLKASATPLSGLMLYQPLARLGQGLMRGVRDTVFLNVDRNQPRPFRPVLDRGTGVLGASWSDNLLQAVLYSDNPAAYPTTTGTAPTASLLGAVSRLDAGVLTVKNQPGWFVFDAGEEAFLARAKMEVLHPVSEVLRVVAPDATNKLPVTELYLGTQPYTPAAPDLPTLQFDFVRVNTTVANTLNGVLMTGGIDALLTPASQLTPEPPFSRLQPTGNVVPPPSDRLDFRGAYGEYFWEVFFHAPFLAAWQLAANQRFDEARRWLQYVYDPTAAAEPGLQNPVDRVWRFLPFRELTPESLAEILTDPAQIAVYNYDPFNPDALARLRHGTYPRAVAMKYIDVILAWGDALFAQDTSESINQATNLYLFAADLLGPRPQSVGQAPAPPPRSFNDMLAAYETSGTAQGGGAASIRLAQGASDQDRFYDGLTIALTGGPGAGERRTVARYEGATRTATVAPPWTVQPTDATTYQVSGIPEFLIQLENAPPMFLEEPPADDGSRVLGGAAAAAPAGTAPFNDIDSYFCIPENAEFLACWDRVEDRLFKIRHCMNIKGVQRQLALFEPPLDVRALVRAAGAGQPGMPVETAVSVPIPFYRFSFMVARARELTGSLMGLGASLLSALQNRDAEGLAMLRQVQEKSLLSLTTQLKELQVAEAEEMEASLVLGRDGAAARQAVYEGLVERGLNPGEVLNLQAMTLSNAFTMMGGAMKTLASIAYLVPNFGSPFAMTYGGRQVGASLDAVGSFFDLLGGYQSFVAALSLTVAGYQRRAQEWGLQASQAGWEVRQLDAQVAAAGIRRQMADRELEVHLRAIAQAEETETFMRRRFTNAELYEWMAAQLSTLYFQTYALAFEAARSAQRAYQYELNTAQTFVNFGYWDTLKKGLLSGEGLMLALNQMEQAYVNGSARPLEIERTISLLQLDPWALQQLRTTGECTFDLPEKLFDQDFPGHYARKLRSVAVSIPAVTGPYQNVRATLTQLTNQVVLRPQVDAVRFLLSGAQGTPPASDALRSNWWINQSVALSRAAGDTGLFEPDLADARYLPFEGTGAVSSWRLSLPLPTNRFDFNAIADVVVQLRYTALDGGTRFRDEVTALPELQTIRTARVFSLAQQYAGAWYALLHDHADAATQVLEFDLPPGMVPPHVEDGKLVSLYLRLVVEAAGTAPGESFLTFDVADGTAPLALSLQPAWDTSVAFAPADQPPVQGVAGRRTLAFDLAKTPASLKGSDGFLSPAALRDVGLIFVFEGRLVWT